METNEERLGRVGEAVASTLISAARRNGKTQFIDDLNWLFEQAERAQELEVWEETARNYFGENVKLREALKFYADPHNHAFSADTATFHRINQSEVMKEFGEIARHVLKGTTEDGGNERKSI